MVNACHVHNNMRRSFLGDDAENDENGTPRASELIEKNATSRSVLGCKSVVELTSPQLAANLITLSLSNSKLTAVPDFLLQMRFLRHLDLSHNWIADVPDCLQSGLEHLEHLDLSNNALRHFETEPRCFRKLKRLLLNDNRIGNLPEWVLHVRCLNLRHLDYCRNSVYDLSESRFRYCCSYRLSVLNMQNCNLEDEDFACIKSIYTLEELDVGNGYGEGRNKFLNVAALFDGPAWSLTMQILKLPGLGITSLPQQIGCLTALKQLDLSRNSLDALPPTFGDLKSLESLNLSGNCFYSIPAFFGHLESLRHFTACHNTIGSIDDSFFALKNITWLDLYDNELQTCPVTLAKLEHVDLDMNYLEEICTTDEYARKRAALRAMKDVVNYRSNAQKKPQGMYGDVDSEDDQGMSSDLLDESDYCDNPVPELDQSSKAVNGEEEECWETQISMKANMENIPDNNWTGRPLRTLTPESKPRIYMYLDNKYGSLHHSLECSELYTDAD